MSVSEAIAQHLLDIHFGENWTDSWITKNLEDVSRKEALQVTAGSVNTVASLLYHITFYNKVIEQRLKGTDPYINESNGFDMPVIHSDEDWEALKADNLQTAKDLAALIKDIPDTRLQQPVLKLPGSESYYRQLHGVIEHAYYHLGQIVILKNIIRKGA
jgi:uncharacterized damage-inducible protein DinB